MDAFIAAFFGSLAGIAGTGCIMWLLRTWLVERIRQSIAYEYAQKLEQSKRDALIRQKAETVASLLAEWMSFPDEQKNLNKLTFEAYLWLPTDILKELTKTLTCSATAPNAREILSSVRKHLIDDSELDASDIVIFKQENERRAFQAKLQEAAAVRPFRAIYPTGARGFSGKK